MELVTFNPTLAEFSSEYGSTITPAPICRDGWAYGGGGVGLNLSDSIGHVTANFLAPPGVRALTVSFAAAYMPEAESNLHPMTWLDSMIRVYVSRINSSQSFTMFDTGWGGGGYNPDPPQGVRDVQLDIDVSKIVVRINGVATLEIVPDGSTIEVDDYVTGISLMFPAGDHIYEVDPPYDMSATSFGVSNFVISPMGIPAAFWTSFVGTREAT